MHDASTRQSGAPKQVAIAHDGRGGIARPARRCCVQGRRPLGERLTSAIAGDPHSLSAVTRACRSSFGDHKAQLPDPPQVPVDLLAILSAFGIFQLVAYFEVLRGHPGPTDWAITASLVMAALMALLWIIGAAMVLLRPNSQKRRPVVVAWGACPLPLRNPCVFVLPIRRPGSVSYEQLFSLNLQLVGRADWIALVACVVAALGAAMNQKRRARGSALRKTSIRQPNGAVSPCESTV